MHKALAVNDWIKKAHHPFFLINWLNRHNSEESVFQKRCMYNTPGRCVLLFPFAISALLRSRRYYDYAPWTTIITLFVSSLDESRGHWMNIQRNSLPPLGLAWAILRYNVRYPTWNAVFLLPLRRTQTYLHSLHHAYIRAGSGLQR